MPGDATSYLLEPSPLVQKYAVKIAEAAGEKPILDVACGSGRNALVLAQLGCTVICVDRDLASLQAKIALLRRTELRKSSARLILHQLDLVKDHWPFPPGVAGGIVNVHFLLRTLFPHFERSLSSGSYLLFESVPGCGGNYLELPKAGEIRTALETTFELEVYQERKVGPIGYDAVTIRALAKKRP